MSRSLAVQVAAAAVLAALVLGFAPTGVAHAQDAPVDRPVEGAARQAVLEEVARQEDGVQQSGDLLGTLLGAGGQTVTPWSHYDLGASVSTFDRVGSLIARMTFAVGRWAIGVAHFLLGWVLRFDLGRHLAPPAVAIASAYQDRLVVGLRLSHLALLIAVGHAVWQLLRSRTPAGLGEVAMALAIATAGGALLSDLPAATCSTLDLLGGTTQAIYVLGTSPDAEVPDRPRLCEAAPAAVDTLGFETALVDTFVVEPHLVLQWGAAPGGGTCRDVADALVVRGAWGDHDFPRTQMEAAGCAGMADFNEQMGPDRIVGTIAYLLAAVAFALAVALSVGTLLIGQVIGAGLLLVLPFALVAGIAPGAGREVLHRYVHAGLKVAVLFIGSAFFLVMLVSAVQAVQEGMAGEPVALRMGSTAAVAWGLVIMRRHVFASLRATSRGVAARIAGPGTDVGPVGRSPGAVVTSGVMGAAANALLFRELRVAGHALSGHALSGHALAARAVSAPPTVGETPPRPAVAPGPRAARAAAVAPTVGETPPHPAFTSRSRTSGETSPRPVVTPTPSPMPRAGEEFPQGGSGAPRPRPMPRPAAAPTPRAGEEFPRGGGG